MALAVSWYNNGASFLLHVLKQLKELKKPGRGGGASPTLADMYIGMFLSS